MQACVCLQCTQRIAPYIATTSCCWGAERLHAISIAYLFDLLSQTQRVYRHMGMRSWPYRQVAAADKKLKVHELSATVSVIKWQPQSVHNLLTLMYATSSSVCFAQDAQQTLKKARGTSREAKSAARLRTATEERDQLLRGISRSLGIRSSSTCVVQPTAKPSAVLVKPAATEPVATELEACAAPAKALQFEQPSEESSSSTSTTTAAVSDRPVTEAAVVSDDEDTTIRSPTQCYHGSRSPDIMMLSLLHVIEQELARSASSDHGNGSNDNGSSSTDMDTDYSSSVSEGCPTYSTSACTPMRHSSHFCAPH
jgi:hypothetical protein